jgi:deaminated glutathione amidase
MSEGIRIAAAQTFVTTDVARNGAAIRDAMRHAADQGAELVHFTEGALSGYGRKELKPFAQWTQHDWTSLRRESEQTAEHAHRLGLWAIFGSVHRLEDGLLPHNSLYVIGPGGNVVTRYDKRFCSHNEISGWYTAGSDPRSFEAKGVRFGCAICLDGTFAEVFDDYRKRGVQCVLLSAFAAGAGAAQKEDADGWGAIARAQAIHHTYWISLVTPANKFQSTPTQIVEPRGTVTAKCARHRPQIALCHIDLGPDGLWGATAWGRAWRDKARSREIYGDRSAQSGRSADRTSF